MHLKNDPRQCVTKQFTSFIQQNVLITEYQFIIINSCILDTEVTFFLLFTELSLDS